MSSAREFNFDGLVGPTHHYAGLSFGNRASMEHAKRVSNPRQAALQGLAKMKLLAELGVPQAVLPPQERPHLPTLRARGFSGGDAQIIARVAKENPAMLSIVSSASSMWAANAATVSPSADCADGKVHFTPANLISTPHRTIEAAQTARVLKRLFPEASGRFMHHDPLPATSEFADEGAANHTRLATEYGESGFEIFTFGRSASDAIASNPSRFPARQSHEASIAIARAHQLDSNRVIFIRQSAAAIDAGAFHNDVVAVGNRTTFLHHAAAYVPGAAEHLAAKLTSCVPTIWDGPLDDAVRSYVFNSQLVQVANGSQAMIAPAQVLETASAKAFVDSCLERGIIRAVHYVDLRQSMQNGGGPACLRLRVVLNDDEAASVHPGVIWSPALDAKLVAWVNRFYRESLSADDLKDPALLRESRDALDELSRILNLPLLYEFQA